MRISNVVALLACAAQAHADSSDTLADSIVDKMVHRGYDSPQISSDLDDSALGKASTLASPALAAPRAGMLPMSQAMRDSSFRAPQPFKNSLSCPTMASSPFFNENGQKCWRATVLKG